MVIETKHAISNNNREHLLGIYKKAIHCFLYALFHLIFSNTLWRKHDDYYRLV